MTETRGWTLPQWALRMPSSAVVLLTVWMEARGEPALGRAAVRRVIHNRARRRRKLERDICLEPWQFSCWMSSSNLSAARALLGVPSARSLLEMAGVTTAHDRQLREEYRAIWDRATHYYNPGLCSPSWAESVEWRVDGEIGGHVFGHF